MNPLTVAVIFGGTNTEHEVSLVSARSVMDHLDPARYTVIPIKISKDNQWTKDDQPITPTDLKALHVDVVFPVLHGPFGEDGTIQGLLEMLQIPYVGCGVLASAVCMDKVVQKQLCQAAGLPVPPFVWIDQSTWTKDQAKTLDAAGNQPHYPLFVKPANQGSSIGVTKVHDAAELIPAIESAFRFDTKVIIEQGIDEVREIECAVLGNHQPKASVLGEIIPSNEFYDYDAKYVDGKSDAKIPADLPPEVAQKIQDLAVSAFTLLNCSGLARVDFLVNRQTNDFYLNELNTLPGFTAISMYPKLWAASGLTYENLLAQLIDLALERHQELSSRLLSYTPKTDWYQS